MCLLVVGAGGRWMYDTRRPRAVRCVLTFWARLVSFGDDAVNRQPLQRVCQCAGMPLPPPLSIDWCGPTHP